MCAQGPRHDAECPYGAGARATKRALATVIAVTRTRRHPVVPVQPRNLAFTYCRVCHQLLVRDDCDHWVHRPDEDRSELHKRRGVLRKA